MKYHRCQLVSLLLSSAFEKIWAWNPPQNAQVQIGKMKTTPIGAKAMRPPVERFSSRTDYSGEGVDEDYDLSSSYSMIQLNHAGASPSPDAVLKRVQRHLELEQRIGGYAAAEAAQDEIEVVYNSVAKLLHAPHKSDIALVESATVAWTRIFYAMANDIQQQYLKGKRPSGGHPPVILISEAEYAASVVAISQWAREHNWIVLAVPSSTIDYRRDSSNKGQQVSSGIVDTGVLKEMLEGNYYFLNYESEYETKEQLLDPNMIAMVCIAHIPTNSGIVNPVSEIGGILQEFQRTHASQKDTNSFPIYYLVDACQSVGQCDLNVQEIYCDALVGTGRKYLRGPRGTGFLYVRSASNTALIPAHVDHFGVPIQTVPEAYEDGMAVHSLVAFTPRSDGRRFEFWESNIANRLGLGVAIDYAMEQDVANIESRCTRIASYLRTKLAGIPSLKVHHAQTSTCGIVTFYFPKVASSLIRSELSRQGFELSVVPATSTPLDSAKTEVPDLLRSSISYETSLEEIDSFVEALEQLLADEKV